MDKPSNPDAERRLIMTVNSGPQLYEYHLYTIPFQREYAARCGADFREITEDDWGGGYPCRHFIKYDAIRWAALSEYERILFIDLDVIPKPDAPNIFEEHDRNSDWLWQDRLMHPDAFLNWCRDIMKRDGDEFHPYYNSGVWLMRRQSVLRLSRQLGPPYVDGWADQHGFNLALRRAELQISDLDEKWNHLASFSGETDAWFLHYAAHWGKWRLMEFVAQFRDKGYPSYPGHVEYQAAAVAEICRRRPTSRILNIGASADPAHLKKRYGAYNVDINERCPWTGRESLIDELADCRAMPPHLHQRFDVVVMGDILEHLPMAEITQSAAEARKCVESSGRILLVTFPFDGRPPEQQGEQAGHEYAPGIPAYHAELKPLPHMVPHIEAGGWNIEDISVIHYPWDGIFGYGIQFRAR